MKNTADVVIVGGGCMGCSVAWHLTQRGMTNVVLIEREPQLAAGSTGKNAGGVRHQFSHPANIDLSLESIAMMARFEEVVGTPIDFHQDGYLFLLSKAGHVATFLKNVQLQQSRGVDVQWLAANRDRIWGLAAAAERAGETSWIADTVLQETLAAEQAERQEVDPWSETVEAWLEGGPGVVFHREDTPRDADGRQVVNSDGFFAEGIVSRAPRISEIDAARRITATEVLRCALGIRDGQQDQTKLNRVAALLIGLGWERRRARRDPNRPRNYWHPPRGDDEVPF